MLWSKGAIVYVGSTRNPSSRVASHRASTKEFDSVSISECSMDDMLEKESAAIMLCKPKYNKTIPLESEFTHITKCKEKANAVINLMVSDLPIQIIGTNRQYIENKHYSGLMAEIVSAADRYLDSLINDARSK